MYIDYSACRSAVDQQIVQDLERMWKGIFIHMYANFYAKEPYLLAQACTGNWHTFSITEARKLAGV